MNLKRYYIVKYKNDYPIVIDLKSVDAILFNKTSIDFCINGHAWTINIEVTKDVIDELIRNWTTVREEK